MNDSVSLITLNVLNITLNTKPELIRDENKPPLISYSEDMFKKPSQMLRLVTWGERHTNVSSHQVKTTYMKASTHNRRWYEPSRGCRKGDKRDKRGLLFYAYLIHAHNRNDLASVLTIAFARPWMNILEAETVICDYF